MDTRKVVLLVGALLVAIVTALFARSLFHGSAAPAASAALPAAPIDGPMVLVATRALPVGTILDASAMKFQPWPKELVDNAYYMQGSPEASKLAGTVVRNAITAGQPVTRGALVAPGDRGFLAAALGPGMRAVTFPVELKTAVAGFVFPGDRVDLVLTQPVPGGGDGPPLKVAETVVRNLRVLATDQRADNLPGDDGKTHTAPNVAMVTVEATPKIAEQIAVAQTLGSLSLSLRSLADNSQELEQAIASGTIQAPSDPRAEKLMLLQLATQPQSGNSTYSTGADVSRFQRRTVPGKTPGSSGPVMGMAAAPGPIGAPSAGAYPGGGSPTPVVRVTRGDVATAVPVTATPSVVPLSSTVRSTVSCSGGSCSRVTTTLVGGN